jgi:hypothetical protein
MKFARDRRSAGRRQPEELDRGEQPLGVLGHRQAFGSCHVMQAIARWNHPVAGLPGERIRRSHADASRLRTMHERFDQDQELR